MEMITTVIYSLICIIFVLVLQFYYDYWVRPGKVLEKLRKQGIPGPSRRFPTGNLHEMKSGQGGGGGGERSITENYSTKLFPYFDKWRKEYGPVFIYSAGNLPSLYVSDPDLVREFGQCVSLNLGKATHLQKAQEPLFGHGIIKSNGVAWAHQRKIISPEFFMDKVKGMVDLMVEAAMPLMKTWESRIERSCEGKADFMVDDDLRRFSAEVISRACFGSSYSRGKDIFSSLTALQKKIANPNTLFNTPLLRYLPLKDNREVRKLVNEVRSLILNIVRERQDVEMKNTDLLQSILDNGSAYEGFGDGRSGFGDDDGGGGDGFVVDNCKNIYFAGHDTSTVAVTWCLMLLASYPEWQSRARAEVVDLCCGGPPNSDILHKMKTLTIVIQETLRLYPPVSLISRESFEDMKFGGLTVPKGTNIWIPITTMHRDKQLWGDDADEFNPERFTNGVSGACKSSHAYLPFGIGARKCVGRNLALAEVKIVLCLILSKFRFSLSTKYKHSPAFRLTVGPEFGLHLVVENV